MRTAHSGDDDLERFLVDLSAIKDNTNNTPHQLATYLLDESSSWRLAS